MDEEVKHTTFEEQQAFIALPPEQRDLMIYVSSRETNGSVAEALRRIGKVEQVVVAHDARLVDLERWQLKAAAVMAAAIIIAPVVFFAFAQFWHR